MGTSLNLPQININPGIGGQGIPAQAPFADAGQAFMQALLASQGNAIQKQRIAVQKQEEERLAREADIRLASARDEGEALRKLILVQAQGQANQMAGAAQEGIQAATGVLGVPRPDIPASAAGGPMGALAGVLPGMSPEAVPAFVQQSRNILTDQQTYADKAQRFQAIEKAIGSIKDTSKQPGARALLTFAEAGANLPAQVQSQLWPELFPVDGSIDPAAMNAATTLFKTGVFTWGQARRQAGLTAVKGIPDDVKYQPFPTRPRQDQLKAGGQMAVMQAAAPIIDAYSEEGSPGPITSFVKGGKSGGWRELLANPLLTSRSQGFLQAARQFTDAWVRVVSGAQTNEHEYGRFLSTIVESFGDTEDTRRQKRNMRQIMIQSVSDIAGGTVTPTGALDRALRLDWLPEQKKFLTEERAKAAKYEADMKAGKVTLDASTPAPGTPDDFAEQMAEMMALLRSREP